MNEIESLKAKIESLTDEQIRYRRTVEDILYNLDFENFSSNVSDTLKQVGDNFAQMQAFVDENKVYVESLASWVKQIDRENEYQEDITVQSALSKITQEASQAGAKVELLAKFEETDLSGESAVTEISNASLIVQAINDQSNIALSADKIELDGITTVADQLNIGKPGNGYTDAKMLKFYNTGTISCQMFDYPVINISAGRTEIDSTVKTVVNAKDILLNGEETVTMNDGYGFPSDCPVAASAVSNQSIRFACEGNNLTVYLNGEIVGYINLS